MNEFVDVHKTLDTKKFSIIIDEVDGFMMDRILDFTSLPSQKNSYKVHHRIKVFDDAQFFVGLSATFNQHTMIFYNQSKAHTYKLVHTELNEDNLGLNCVIKGKLTSSNE